jgi:hypothetical protein
MRSHDVPNPERILLSAARDDAPRIIVAGATTAITLRKAFLAPWHPLVGEIWRYALAYAQQQTGVAVHHGICVITHHHLTVTPQARNLPEFTHLFHKHRSAAPSTLCSRASATTNRASSSMAASRTTCACSTRLLRPHRSSTRIRCVDLRGVRVQYPRSFTRLLPSTAKTSSSPPSAST